MNINKKHWEKIYTTKRSHEVSWTQLIPKTSLHFLHSFRLSKDSSIIDIGGGESRIGTFSENGPNEVCNGMLLRSDFHKLFDLGFITATQDYSIEVSPRIREEWFNGKAYYRLHGQKLTNLPDVVDDQPSLSYLRWHNENRYRA